MLRRRSRRVRLAHYLHRRRASRRADVRRHGQDSDHYFVRRCARRVSEGPRSRREAARYRCPSFLRGGGGQGSRLCARLRRAGEHRRYQSRVRRGGDEGRRPGVEGERRRTAHGARARGRAQERPRGRAASTTPSSWRGIRTTSAPRRCWRTPTSVVRSTRPPSITSSRRRRSTPSSRSRTTRWAMPTGSSTSTGQRRPRSRSTSSSSRTIRTRTTRMPSS